MLTVRVQSDGLLDGDKIYGRLQALWIANKWYINQIFVGHKIHFSRFLFDLKRFEVCHIMFFVVVFLNSLLHMKPSPMMFHTVPPTRVVNCRALLLQYYLQRSLVQRVGVIPVWTCGIWGSQIQHPKDCHPSCLKCTLNEAVVFLPENSMWNMQRLMHWCRMRFPNLL